ncbi:unnamed protein product (macronuclear) [Paramecium tetraurelia]|uniref:U2A'/phosphoprotein 32 family A C-terminal domain-containing protein n=1 Tax=Paramecium tetraurelia TaxID=5888 RepID=A0BNB5_PARTE|nr:uncharacterized protein GSPATT00030670001 [Paramecium tetraurelia]CAK60032.1 unnamed protein product [Paramecium tetraurelia]|eukprot:XP_001427430.1 hypothetical protein (macronuclear) [Paramecium tetraurelia strain d4-2]
MSGNKKMDALISMKAEIQAQKEGQEKIQKLCFENINIGQFTNETLKLLSKYNDLICLEFNDCKLSSLDNLIGFPNLTKLRLCNNYLDKNSLQHIIQHFPKVTHLDISGNKKISEDDLKVLVDLKELQHLVFNDKDTNRALLFEQIPQLSYIDHKDKAGNEIEDEENEDEEDEDEEDEDEEDEEEEDDEDDEDEDGESAEEAEESEVEQAVQKKKKI